MGSTVDKDYKNRLRGEYKSIASSFLTTGDEEHLYRFSLLGKKFIEANLGPEEVIEIHSWLLEELPIEYEDAGQKEIMAKLCTLLLEIMMSYGHAHRENQNVVYWLKEQYEEIKAAKNEIEKKTSALIQIEKMTALGELAAAIAHEISQPLNAIKLICEDVKRDIDKDQINYDDFRNSVGEVVGEVRKMTEIVRKVCTENNRRYIGKTLDVLVTEEGKGRTENYKQVALKENAESGSRIKVKIKDANHGSLFG